MAVSAVLNGAGSNVSVSAATAERIRKAAEELRYRPNHLARSFRKQKTGQIAVVFQHFYGLSPERPYRIHLLSGVMRALFAHDYTLSLCPVLNRQGDPGYISDGRFDGVLWCRPDLTESNGDGLREARIPVVVMHAPEGSIPGVPSFCADNDGAMRRVVQHLADLGHRHLGFVIDVWSRQTVEGQARGQALMAAAYRAGLPEPVTILHTPEPEWLNTLSQPDSPITALVCFSDDLAASILDEVPKHGMRIPEDLSVVGFDSSPFCEKLTPRLTSVNQPVEQMAFEATSLLINLINAGEQAALHAPATTSIYDCELDVRASTAPPRAR